ncbi:MAG: hypothetical protein J0I45_08400 [Bosea sp.]|nr:hypothetical protein [Bosea sp. (in: a-proteobacteria)]
MRPGGKIADGATVVGIEASPSFYAATTSSHTGGEYDDSSLSIYVTRSFGGGIFAGGVLEADLRPDKDDQYYVEATVGYTFNFGRFSFSPSVLLGDTWGGTGFGADGNSSAFYYALYADAAIKLDEHWHFNALSLRYRNAFDYTWITPEIGSGFSYRLDSGTSFYGSAAYSWKDTGEGMHPDTMSLTVGVRQPL